jgi:DNA gyrase subunit B
MAKKDLTYDATSIEVLEGLDPVRKRPGMYIGGTGKQGLHHLIWEVIDNSIDEAMGGYCDKIRLILEPDNAVTIVDNGRGIPVEKHKTTKKSALETVLTTLHAGGKFGSKTYQVSGGLHGVGVSVVNALSSSMEAKVKRDGTVYRQEYKQGKPKSDLKKGKDKDNEFMGDSGTIIKFKPDHKIFDASEFDFEIIKDHLRQQAYLTKGVQIELVDRRKEKETDKFGFYFEGGVRSYVRYLSQSKEKVSDPIYIEGEENNILVEVSLRYTDDYSEQVLTFANNIYTENGGTHLTGFRSALTRVINDYIKKQDLGDKSLNKVSGEDTREGLTAVISVKLKEPQFEGQTKTKLGNPEVRSAVESLINESLSSYFEENPQDAGRITERSFLAAKARTAAKKARETVIRKGALNGLALPGKLADCTSKDPDNSELFIVEGDSAGGSSKQGRDRMHQAILPLRGKVLNVERKRLDRILENNELKSLILAMGMGVGEEKDIEELRYDRVIIMCDADTDGAHIATLLLTFFYRYFKEIIQEGHLYIAQAPLYKVQKGKKQIYAYTEKERKEALDNLGEGANIQRYKGLGEMNPSQLWKTTMDPETRILNRVTVSDAQKADKTFTTLMGKEVEPRKRFIQTHAKSVENLDV